MSAWSSFKNKVKSVYKKLVSSANKAADNRSGGSNASSGGKKPSQSSNSKPKSSGSSSSGSSSGSRPSYSRPSSSGSTGSTYSRSTSSGTTQRRSGSVTSSKTSRSRSGAITPKKNTSGSLRSVENSTSGAIVSARDKMRQEAQKANEKREKANVNALGTKVQTHELEYGSDYREFAPMVETAKNRGIANHAGKVQSEQASKEIDKQVKKLKKQGYDIDEKTVAKQKKQFSQKKLAEDVFENLEKSRAKENAKKRDEWNKTHKGTLRAEDLTSEDYLKLQNASRIGGKAGKAALGKELSEKVGSMTAYSAGKNTASKAATGFLQGVAYGDVLNGGVETYNKAAKGVLKDVKESKAYERGYMGGQAAGFMASGVGQAGRGIVGGIGKKAAEKALTENLAKNIGKEAAEGIVKRMASKANGNVLIENALKKRGVDLAKTVGESTLKKGAKNVAADMAASLPMDVADAAKMSIDENGKIDKKAFASTLALNSVAFGGGMGAAMEAGSAALARSSGKKLVQLQAKANAGNITQAERDELQGLYRKVTDAKNDLTATKSNIAGKYIGQTDLSLKNAISEADSREYFRLKAIQSERKLIGKENTELKRLTKQMNLAKIQYDDSMRRVVAETKLSIGKASSADVARLRKASAYFEVSGDKTAAKEAEKLLSKAEKNFDNTLNTINKAAAKVSHDLGREFKIESSEEILNSFAATGGKIADPSQFHGFAEFDDKGNIIAYHVNKDSEQAMAFTFGHEFTHGFESLGKEYDEFVADLKSFVGDEWDAEMDLVRTNYAEVANANYDNEVVANLVAKHFFSEDGAYLKKLAGEKPSLFARIYQMVKKLVTGSTETDAQMEALSKRMDEMFDSLSEQNKSIVLGSPDSSEMLFGGGRTLQDIIDSGVNNDVARELQDNLQMARNSLKYAIQQSKGDYKELAKARKQIFKDYGWLQGADGKWRYEIDDSRMRFEGGMKISSTHKDGSLVYYDKYAKRMVAATQETTASVTERINQLRAKNKLTKKEQTELDGLRKQVKFRQLFTKDGLPLGSALQHEKFFELYPDAKGIRLKLSASARKGFGDIQQGDRSFSAGGYLPDPTGSTPGTLYINAHILSKDTNIYKALVDRGDDPAKYLKETITHELQHYVQGVEGFAEGGNPNMFKQSIEEDDVLFPKHQADKAKLDSLRDTREDLSYDMEDIDEGGLDDAMAAYFDALKENIKDTGKIETYQPYGAKNLIDAKKTNAGIGFDDLLEDLGGYFGHDNPDLADIYVDTMYADIKDRLNVPNKGHIVNKKFDDLFKEYLKTDFSARQLAESNPDKLYKRLAGEGEAFETQKRTFMSKAERKRNLPAEIDEPIYAKNDMLVSKDAFKRNNVELSYGKMSDEESAYYDSLVGETEADEAYNAEVSARGNSTATPPEDNFRPTAKMRQAERDAANESRRFDLDEKAENNVVESIDADEARPDWEKNIDDNLFAHQGTKELTNFKRGRTRLKNKGEWNEETAQALYDRVFNGENPKKTVEATQKSTTDVSEEVAKDDERVLDDEFEPTPEMLRAEREAANEGSRYLDKDEVEPKLKEKTISDDTKAAETPTKKPKAPTKKAETPTKKAKEKPKEMDAPNGEEKPKKPETPAQEKKEDAPTIEETLENAKKGYISSREMGLHAKKLGESWSSEVEMLDQSFKKAAKNGEIGGKKVRAEAYDDAFKKAETAVDEDFDKVWKRVMNREDGIVETVQSAAEKHALMKKLVERAGSGDETAAMLHLKLIDKMDSGGSLAGHMLQLQSYVLKDSPEGRLRYMLRQVKRINKEYANVLKGKEIELTPDQVRMILNAKDAGEAARVAEAIGKDIWKQVPSGFLEAANQIRHWAMLFNPKTHGRNVGGNLVFKGAREMSDALEITATRLAQKTGKGKRLLGDDAIMGKTVSRKELSDCGDVLNKRFEDDYAINEQHADRWAEGGRTAGYLNENTSSKVLNAGAKTMNKLIDVNYNLLDREDRWFFRPAYKKEYIRYCKSKGFTENGSVTAKSLEKMTDAQKKAATDWAMERAKIATFRDDSAISKRIIEWKSATEKTAKTPMGNLGKKALNVGMESILPFVKTPVNILRRGADYSPIGLFRGVSEAVVAKDAAAFMDGIHHLSTGLTGTGVFALGWWAASHDWVTVNAGDVSGDAFYDRDMGYQDYSLKVHVLGNDYSASMDWMAPMQFAFFQGAAVQNQKGGEWDTEQFLKILEASVNPMMEMSFMSSAKDTAESFFQRAYRDGSGAEASFAEAAGRTLFGSMPQGWLGSFVPQFVSQAAGFSDDKMRDTSSTAEDELKQSWEKWARQIQNRFPGMRQQLNPKLDRKGKAVSNEGVNVLTKLANSFANPSNVKRITYDKYDQEIIDIYSKMEEGSKKTFFLMNFTGNPSYDIKGDNLGKGKGDRRMTYQERYDYMKKKRREQWKDVQTMVDAKSYKDMTNDMKVDEISDAHYISTVKADRKVYGDKYAKNKLIDGDDTQSEIWKKVKTFGGNAKDYVDSYIAVESLQARSHASISDYHMKALAIESMNKSKEKKDSLEKAYGVWGDKVKPARKFIKQVGDAGKALVEYSDAFCSGAGFCKSNEVTTSKRNMSVGLANVTYKVRERTYRAMGYDWQSAQAGGGLKKYGYSYEALEKMESDALTMFDSDHNNSLKKDEVIAYVDSLGIEDVDEKACIFQYINNNASKNPYAIIKDHLEWGTEPDAEAGYSGSRWGRRGYGGGWGGYGGGGWGGGSGGSSGGTMPTTETGAIKGTVTDPFGKVSKVGAKSNLDDAYRKKAKKLLEANRKKLS